MRFHLSFALRALVALALLFGFYALAAGLTVGLLYVPYGMFVHLHRISPKLSIACLVGAFAIARACFFLKTPAFHAPGPELHEKEQPALFALIHEISRQMGTRMPAHVYLIPEVNAFVAEVGGFMGFGTTRVMGIGMGLLAIDDVSQLKATLAHEFGHFTGGDTMLGGVVYRTRVAIGRVLQSLDGGVLAKPFELYGKLYLRVTHAVSRHQELEADRASVTIAGREAHIEGLEREARGGLLFEAFVMSELAPLCEGGVCPSPLYDGFTSFLEAAPRERIDKMIAEHATDPLDTHPALSDRVAFARALPAQSVARDTRSALTLLRSPREVETAIEPYIFGRLEVRGALTRIGWDEVTTKFYAPKLEEEARMAAERLYPLLNAGPRYGDVVAALAAALPERKHLDLARAIEPRIGEVRQEELQEAVRVVLGRALGVLAGSALVERGGAWQTSIGKPLTVAFDGKTLSPLTLGRKAAETREGLDAYVAELGIT